MLLKSKMERYDFINSIDTFKIFLQGKDLVFQVEVLSKGKSSGKNKNYLNIRYTDGSVGGVFIDKHEWRILKKGTESASNVQDK